MTESKLVALSPVQREIMDIIWDGGEMTATEIHQVFSKRRTVIRNTVSNLIMRIEEKGWLKHRAVGPTYVFSPVFPREATIGQRVVEVVDTVCCGSAETLMNALLEYCGLTNKEMDAIRAMINQANQKKKRTGRK